MTAMVLLALIVAPPADEPIKVELKSFVFKVPDNQKDLVGHNTDEEKLFYYINGTAEAEVTLPKEGEYEIVIKASGVAAMNEQAKFKVRLDGKDVGKETTVKSDEPMEYKFTVKAKDGKAKLAVEYTNDVYKENEYDRNFFLHAVTLTKK